MPNACRYCMYDTDHCQRQTWVYQIHKGSDVIYVGMTTREPLTRITEHRKGWEHLTWEAALYPCEWEARDTESYLIHQMNPRNNTLRPVALMDSPLPPLLEVAVSEPGTTQWP